MTPDEMSQLVVKMRDGSQFTASREVSKTLRKQALSASIAGAGAIDYWGNPSKIKQSIAGVGSVTSRGVKRSP